MKHTIMLILTAALAGCGGSGGAASSGTAPSQSVLLLDSAAGTEDSLTGRLLVVALERPDGTFTGNLLARETECTFADPLGTPTVLALGDLPADTFVALRFLFARGTFEVRGRDGQRDPVDLDRDDHRVVFEDPFEHRAGVPDWLEVRHRGNLALIRGSGRPLWRPDLGARRGADQVSHGFRVTAVKTDAATRTIDALARANPGPGSVPVRLRVADAALLVSHREHRVLTVAEFFARVTPGRELRVQGSIDPTFTFLVTAAEVRDQGQGGESEHEVLGRIEAIGAGTTFQFQMLAVRRGGALLPRLPLSTVEAGTAFIHASGGGHRPLPFTDLRAGMLVEVEWNGAFEQNPIPAREVEIERDGGGAAQPEFEGAVGSVDLNGATITMVPRRDDPLIVGGRAVPSAVVRISPATYLFRDHPVRGVVTLAQVFAGERLWVRGALQADGSVAASWVRVRAER